MKDADRNPQESGKTGREQRTVYLTAEDRQKLERAAEQASQTLSAYIVDAAVGRSTKARPALIAIADAMRIADVVSRPEATSADVGRACEDIIRLLEPLACDEVEP